LFGVGAGLLLSVAVGTAFPHLLASLRPPTAASRKSERQPTDAKVDARQRLAKHNAEARSPTWAPDAELKLREELMELGTADAFELVGVECRTTSCVARTRWQSTNRSANHSVIAHRVVSVRCNIASFPPDDNGDAMAFFENCTAL